MPLTSNVHASDLGDVLDAALAAAGGDVLLVNPTREAVERLVSVATSFDADRPTIRVVARDGVLKDVMDDFIVASRAADLVESGALRLRTGDLDGESPLVVTESAVLAIVSAGDRVAALPTDDEEFVAAASEAFGDAWERAAEYTLRTPALSRVRETLAADLSPAVRADFDAVLASLEAARGDDGLDEVTISLLVAARNDVLLYDVSKWGEDVGIASKATFSRTKTRLEELGLIDTEKVPIDVGRPRLRLKFGDERLRSADATELADVARRLIG